MWARTAKMARACPAGEVKAAVRGERASAKASPVEAALLLLRALVVAIVRV